MKMNTSMISRFLYILKLHSDSDNKQRIYMALKRKGMIKSPTNVYTRKQIMAMSDEFLVRFMTYLGMESKTDFNSDVRWLIYKALDERDMISEPNKGPFDFAYIPTEVQLNILEHVSSTAREVAAVSKGMKELSDYIFDQSISDGTLIDPTLGVDNIDQYFRIDKDKKRYYFSPSPGLMSNIKYIEVSNQVKVCLLYGVLTDGTRFMGLATYPDYEYIVHDCNEDGSVLESLKFKYDPIISSDTDNINPKQTSSIRRVFDYDTGRRINTIVYDKIEHRLTLTLTAFASSNTEYKICSTDIISDRIYMNRLMSLNNITGPAMFKRSMNLMSNIGGNYAVHPIYRLRMIHLDNTSVKSGTMVFPSVRTGTLMI